MAFKCVKGLAPPSLCNKFSTRSQVHTRNTRNKDNLHIPSFKWTAGQWSFSYRAVQLWNDLPESLANIESFNVFKNTIKGRALDEFSSHWHSIGVIMHILYFLNNMVMFYHFQMFILDLLLFMLDFIVIGMWKPILIGCTNKVDWLIDYRHNIFHMN